MKRKQDILNSPRSFLQKKTTLDHLKKHPSNDEKDAKQNKEEIPYGSEKNSSSSVLNNKSKLVESNYIPQDFKTRKIIETRQNLKKKLLKNVIILKQEYEADMNQIKVMIDDLMSEFCFVVQKTYLQTEKILCQTLKKKNELIENLNIRVLELESIIMRGERKKKIQIDDIDQWNGGRSMKICLKAPLLPNKSPRNASYFDDYQAIEKQKRTYGSTRKIDYEDDPQKKNGESPQISYGTEKKSFKYEKNYIKADNINGNRSSYEHMQLFLSSNNNFNESENKQYMRSNTARNNLIPINFQREASSPTRSAKKKSDKFYDDIKELNTAYNNNNPSTKDTPSSGKSPVEPVVPKKQQFQKLKERINHLRGEIMKTTSKQQIKR